MCIGENKKWPYFRILRKMKIGAFELPHKNYQKLKN